MLWGRLSTVWCLPSCPRLNKRFRWGVAPCGLSRSKDWPAQRHSAIVWLPWEPGGENGNSLDAPASPCLLLFGGLSFRSLLGYQPKRGHESVVEHQTSRVVSNISHGFSPSSSPWWTNLALCPRAKSSGTRNSTLIDQKHTHNRSKSVLMHASWLTYDTKDTAI